MIIVYHLDDDGTIIDYVWFFSSLYAELILLMYL